jgi:hypothetical protein
MPRFVACQRAVHSSIGLPSANAFVLETPSAVPLAQAASE